VYFSLLDRLTEAAKLLMRQALPIKCLEALAVGVWLTKDMPGIASSVCVCVCICVCMCVCVCVFVIPYRVSTSECMCTMSGKVCLMS
jgi:hypothetical protein